MKLGDLIRIKSLKKSITGLVIVERGIKCGWACILDCAGNIIWWPPEDVVTLSDEIDYLSRGQENDLERH